MDRDDSESQTISIQIIRDGDSNIQTKDHKRNMNLKNVSSSQYFFSGDIKIDNSKSALTPKSSKSDNSFEDFTSADNLSRDSEMEMKSVQEQHQNLLQPQVKAEPEKHHWKSQMGNANLK